MVMTPWGDASTLRERRLSPRRARDREEIEQNQRERLYAAMVALCSEKGFAATAVGDLAELSGVSSRTFYELFADKEECFLRTMEEILVKVQQQIVGELSGNGQVEDRAERAARAMVRTMVAQPAAARLWLVEAFCAGEQARRRVEGMLWALGQMLGRALEEGSGGQAMPQELTRSVLGGVAGVVYKRLSLDEADAIPEIEAGLREWAFAIPVPPGPLRPRVRRRRTLPGGSPPFAAHVPAERIVRAFAAVAAKRGYEAATIAEIASVAGVSPNTFYTHFNGKEDALHAALDSSGAQMIAATLPAVRRAADWREAMRVAAETLCSFFVAEPDFAHLREVTVYSAGPRAVAIRDRTGEELVDVLAALGGMPRPDSLQVEASLAALHSMLYEWIRAKGAETLIEMAPMATYLMLAPVLGAEAAYEVACS
jgi:AcrR family transcriptional regulator